MPTTPVISVIVPVYKAERYLNECIDSILAQTFSDFELILVDDGSPDRSGEICDQYAAEDARIRVIHKPNGGVSSARNAGFEITRGKYITFVDADDWLDHDCLTNYFNAISDPGVDVATGTIRFLHPNGSTYDHKLWSPIKDNKREISDYIVSPWNCLCGNILRRSLLTDNNLTSPVGITLCEDFHIMVRAIFYARKVVAVTNAIYFYRDQDQSLCHNIGVKEYKSARYAYASTIEFFKANNYYETTQEAMAWRMISACIDLVSDSSGFNQFIQLNYPHKNKIANCPFISGKLKLVMWCLTHHMRLISTAIIRFRNMI